MPLKGEHLLMYDEFTHYYAEFLDGTYDCVDRIVLNGYFWLGQSPGGFRTWWRRLYGSDDNLDNAHLMRMAGRLSRRVRAFAKKLGIPVLDCRRNERKHELAQQYLPVDPNFIGVFLILVNRAPAPVWDVQHNKNGVIRNIARKNPQPWVNHYSFHIIDPEWGHLTIKLCGHPPFNAQIILNGHEYVAQQAKKTGIDFTKIGNCFTSISDVASLAHIAETLCSENTIGRLCEVCDRWIYSACLCFALDLADQENSGFWYSYSVYQSEYSRNLLFTRGTELEQVFQGLIDRTRSRLDVKTLKTILGTKRRPFHRQGRKPPREEVVVERPAYDLTVFKIHFGKITAKCYTKGERVLRIEIIVHNARVLPCGRSIDRFPEITMQLRSILNRFLDAVHCIDIACISIEQLDHLPTSSCVGKTRVGGIDINKPRMRAVIKGVVELATTPQGFRVAELAAKVNAIIGTGDGMYTPRMASYDLKKLRGKDIIRKRERSRRYETVSEGLQVLTALLILRDRVIKPVLAGACKPKRGPKPKNSSRIDMHYRVLQHEMYDLFKTIGIAA